MTNQEVQSQKDQESKSLVKSECFGASDDLGANDLLLGRIVVTQAMSKIVQDDNNEIKAGQLVNMLTNEVMGDTKKKMAFIPIKSIKYWIEKDGNTDQFIRKVPANDPNELPWEEMKGNQLIKRMYHHAFFILLPSEIEGMEEMPLELAFRSTSLQSARSSPPSYLS